MNQSSNRYNYPSFKPWFGTEADLRKMQESNPSAFLDNRVEKELELARLEEMHYNLELQMIDYALENQLQLTLGKDKNGQRMLIHQHDLEGEYALDTYKLPGQWWTSTDSCTC